MPLYDVENGKFAPDPPAVVPAPAPVRAASGIANPAPLGLLCFGMTTTMLMFEVAGWAKTPFIHTIITYAVIYGGAGQILAGMWEMAKGNTFAATAFTSYGCFWIAFFLEKYLGASQAGVFGTSDAVGGTLLDVLWGCFTFAFFIPTLRKNGALMTVFGSLALTFFLLAAGHWSKPAHTAAGYFGLFCGLSAIYTAFAEIYHEAMGWAVPGLAPVNFL